MAFVKRVNTAGADRALTELDAIAGEHAALQEKLNATGDRRDQLVREASELGATRRAVAKAARLSTGRVQQLVDG